MKAVNPKKLVFNVSDRNNTKRRHDFQAYLTKEYERGKAVQSPARKQDLFRPPVKKPYKAISEMTSRFDLNNRELNKRRFAEQYAHIK